MRNGYIILIGALLLFVSCSREQTYKMEQDKNGVKVITNYKAAQPELKLKLTEVLNLDLDKAATQGDLSGLKSIASIAIDKDSNLYVADFRSCKIFKFDQKGNFIKSFSQSGEGPGENLAVFHIASIMDTLFVYGLNGKISKFDLDGKFINQKIIFDAKYQRLDRIKHINNNAFFVGSVINYDPNGVDITTDLAVFLIKNTANQETQLLKRQFAEKLTKHDYMMSKYMTSIDFAENKFYVEDMSKDVYGIDVFDYSGKLIERIKKQVRKIPLSKRQKAIIDSINVVRAGKIHLIGDFKRQIEQFVIDKSNNLWVKPAVENTLYWKHNDFDIFNSDGVFLNRIVIPFDGWCEVRFVEDKLVLFNDDKMILKLYDYSLE